MMLEIPLTTVTPVPITTRLERLILKDYHDFPTEDIHEDESESCWPACFRKVTSLESYLQQPPQREPHLTLQGATRSSTKQRESASDTRSCA